MLTNIIYARKSTKLKNCSLAVAVELRFFVSSLEILMLWQEERVVSTTIFF